MSEFCLVQLKAQIFFNPYLITDDKREYLLNITIPDFEKDNCFIGNQKIEKIIFHQINGASKLKGTSEIKRSNEVKSSSISSVSEEKRQSWMVYINIKTEFQVNEWGSCTANLAKLFDEILKMLCQELTLKSAIELTYLDKHGINEFSYRILGCTNCNKPESKMIIGDKFVLNENVKTISNCDINVNPNFLDVRNQPDYFTKTIESDFIRAMGAADGISRFILLYVIFEEIYKTNSYQNLKQKWELTQISPKSIDNTNKNSNKDSNSKRAKLLLEWFTTECRITEYLCANPDATQEVKNQLTKSLTENVLLAIIKTRNDLFHRGDLSKVYTLMYCDLIPIILKLIQSKDKKFEGI